MNQVEILNQRLKVLRSQLEQLAMMFIEVDKSKATLEALKNNGEIEDALVPVSSFLTLKVQGIQGDKVLIPVGMNYFIETDVEDGIKRLEKIRKKLEEHHEKLSRELRESEMELVELLKQSRNV